MSTADVWLTVIIPIYNGEKYLRKCLSSVAAQTFTNFEVLMIDDGSSDNSADICKEFAGSDGRFQYCKKENSGPLSARLYGLERVSSQYFTFCDADDYYANSQVFQFLFDKVRGINEPISFVQFGYIKKYNHMKQTIKPVEHASCIGSQEFNKREYPKLLCSFWDQARLTVNVWNKLYSRSVLKNLPLIEERVFWGDDQILNIYLLENAEGAYYLPDPLYVYRQSSGGTSRFSMHTMEDLDKVKKYQLKFLERRNTDDDEPIRRTLFSETAGWFLVYLKEAADHLDENELRELIVHTLELPGFRLAHQFYQAHPEEWQGAQLMRKADVDEYVKAAYNKSSKTLKQNVLHAVKDIYKRI